MQDYEVKEIFGEDYPILEKAIQTYLIASNDSLVTCSCGNIIEVVEGQIDLNQKDEQGKGISRDAAISMSKYRVRCNEC